MNSSPDAVRRYKVIYDSFDEYLDVTYGSLDIPGSNRELTASYILFELDRDAYYRMQREWENANGQ